MPWKSPILFFISKFLQVPRTLRSQESFGKVPQLLQVLVEDIFKKCSRKFPNTKKVPFYCFFAQLFQALMEVIIQKSSEKAPFYFICFKIITRVHGT